jgi:hypothetical protein
VGDINSFNAIHDEPDTIAFRKPFLGSRWYEERLIALGKMNLGALFNLRLKDEVP